MIEAIYVALWNLILNSAGIKGEFVTMGRYLIPVTELTPDQMPALFLVEHGGPWKRTGKGIPAIRTLHCSVVMYVTTADPQQSLPATLINNTVSVLDALMGNPSMNYQNLGGLVEHVYIEGETQVIEGQIGTGQNASVALIPLTILIP